MSLREVLSGLWWEAKCFSQTTGSGAMAIDSTGSAVWQRPPWAKLYIIHLGSDQLPWEVGRTQDFDFQGGAPPRMPRAPIISTNGIGIPVNWSAGLKSIEFADHVPAALKRYLLRLEGEWRSEMAKGDDKIKTGKRILEAMRLAESTPEHI